MSNALKDNNFPSQTCLLCSKIYKTSFVLNLNNCNHDLCKVCLCDDNNKTGNITCPICQSPITESELEIIRKCIHDTRCNLEDTTYEKIYISSGGVLVRNINGILHYLAVLHKNGDWVSPKGRIEGIETSLEAAKREIMEEVGLESITLIDFVCKQCYTFSEIGKMYKKTVFWYLFSVEKPNELKLNEEEDFIDSKWLSYGESLNTFSHDSFVSIIKMADSMLKG